MKNSKKISEKIIAAVETNFFETDWKDSWTYIKRVVDVVR
jgi:hypothetical protein